MSDTMNRKPNDTRHRVYRSGSWYYSSAVLVRAAVRNVGVPLFRNNDLGFRTALTGRQPR